jgi:hypothetical protein
LWNIWSAKSGKPAAQKDRRIVFAAMADAVLYREQKGQSL